MNKQFKYDYYRMTGNKYKLSVSSVIEMVFKNNLKYVWVIRKLQTSSCKPIKPILEIYRHHLSKKHGIDIHSNTQIGKGFAMFHAYGITINPQAVIGENVNISKGATIGLTPRGKYKGCPVIGNRVYIGINSTLVGNIKIGNNVLIAPNAFVNRDVPNNSIVIGNPATIIPNDKATEGYINFLV